jgi:hypothetical protein
LPSDRPAIAFAIDSKPYWRSSELRKIGIAYKKGRKSRTRKGLSYAKSLFIREVISLGLPVLGLPGQEADDVASLIVRSDSPDIAKRLVTTDNDWCGLIDPEKSIDWYCLHGYYPRYRSRIEHLQQSKQGKDSGIQCIEDFYTLKQRIGDKGDNVPPDSPAWATDILNPLPCFDPILTPEGQALVSDLYRNFDTYSRITQALGLLGPKYRRWLFASGARQIIT